MACPKCGCKETYQYDDGDDCGMVLDVKDGSTCRGGRMSQKRAPVGYRLEFKPGDPCYYRPEDYEKERQAGHDGADIWGLFPEPQPGCPSEVEVYHGWCWVQPRYVSAVRDMTGFTPLYRGPLLQRAPIDEDVLHVFPSLVENRLREERPDLYPPSA